MADATQSREGRYLYAVVGQDDAQTWREGASESCPGIGGGTVYCIESGGVAAVVSDVPNERLRPNRRSLSAHHGVLKALLAGRSFLPMAFGIIAENEQAVRRILSHNEPALAQQLHRVDGKVEMSLRVTLAVPNIFEYFVATHGELRALRDELFRGGREPSREDKIELGRAFDRALGEDRARQTDLVERILSRCCCEIKSSPPRTEQEVMNLACLVSRGSEGAFEQAVFEAAKRFDDSFAFDFSGPWPAFNFVDVDLEL